MNRTVVALVSPALLLAGPALAQRTQVPAVPGATNPRPPAEAKTVGEVVVSGAAPDVRTSIDRTSYNIAKDLQATSGSIGDALRNVPSVEVDVQGNVSLRGDSNVTIMIDGKPSGMFRGEGRAAALQSLPADQIERVEVITNPSAAFNPEGGAGVINLISKKSRKAGYSGSVRANYGTEGRSNLGLSGGYNSKTLGFSGDVGYRTDPQKFVTTDERQVRDAVSGAWLPSLDRTQTAGEGRIFNTRGSVDWDPNAANRLSGELRYIDMKADITGYEHYEGRNAAGSVVRVFDRLGDQEFRRKNGEASATWRRKFKGDDHDLVVNGSLERTEMGGGRTGLLSPRLPSAPDSFDLFSQDTTLDQLELKADYTRPMPGQGKLKVGYLLQVDNNDYDNVLARGPTGAGVVVDPAFSNRFRYDQTINAGYVTYEQPFGDLTVLGGVRLEEVQIDLDQVTSNIQAQNDYFRAYPSLHLAYKISDEDRVTASYSRRVQRPQAFDLNPFLVYVDPLNYRQGNPNLKPQETDSFEVAYQRRHAGTLYLATLFYRQSQDGVTDVVRDLGGGVLLSTKENLGESRSGGIELVANGRLSKSLTYNINGNAFWNEIDAHALGFTGRRSGTSLSGRANLNWQVTAKDFVQVNGFMQGDRLTPQGRRKASGLLNLGYRHKFSDSVSGVVTVQDVLKTFGNEQVIDTPNLRQTLKTRGNFQGVYLGLTWTFGGQGQKPREPAFDFGGGGGPG